MRWTQALLVSASLLAPACRPAPEAEPLLFEGEIMGTTYAVRIIDPLTPSDSIATSRAIDRTLESIDGAMSTYDDRSELSRFNASPGGLWVELSTDTYAVLTEALRVSELTGGAFDVTVAPLVRAWGFGAGAAEVPSPPSEEVRLGAMALVGPRHLELTDDPPSARKDADGVECDLSAIAKGYAVDAVAEMLERRGVTNYMVEVGGEVRTLGKNASGEAWRIGIEKPLAGARGLQRTVSLAGLSMATSGDYRNFYEVDGKLYSHLIDPREGRPVTHRLASVSVVDHTCMRADALASALLVLGPDEGYDLAVQHDLAVLFLIRSESGEVEELATPSFAELFGAATMEP